MAAIPINNKSLLGLINLRLEADQEDSRRRHLGGSQIGNPCARELWYAWRWCKQVKHEARILRLFSRGHFEEPRFVKMLESVGVVVDEVDPVTKKQFKVVAVDGHFGGSLDGIGMNVPEAPKTAHLLEFKTHNDKSFKKLLKVGMRSSKPVHYAQMQIYMKLMGLTRGVYMAVNKNDDSLHVERVRYDKAFADKTLEKATSIIMSALPPKPLDPNQSRMECGWCDFSGICGGIELPQKSCRSCLNVAPAQGGRWHCGKYNCYIDPVKDENGYPHENDREGCDSYQLIPALNLES